MDFSDGEAEAAFRAQLRSWVRDNNPHLPQASTSDEYWERQPAWHQALYAAGYFGLQFPKEYGGHEMPPQFDVILDEELAAAGAPPRPSLGYLVHGMLVHASEATKKRFLPDLISGRDRWCQGFSEPEAGSDLAALRTRAVRDGDEYVINGHKIWTSYSDLADWCFLLCRTDPNVPKHKGLSVFAVEMDQPGRVEQRPLRMMNGITREFGEVTFTDARVAAENMIGEPGDGWRIAMTVVNHEREPAELGNSARYLKQAHQLVEAAKSDLDRYDSTQLQDLAWAVVESDMLQHHVARRLSERLDGITHGPRGSVDKLLMIEVEQAIGHAALAARASADRDDTWLRVYLYSRAQSVMGGTAQIQRNLVASHLLGLPST